MKQYAMHSLSVQHCLFGVLCIYSVRIGIEEKVYCSCVCGSQHTDMYMHMF